MANHAYVVPKKMPPIKQIDKDVREIIEKKFPFFNVEFNQKEKIWFIECDDISLSLSFWIGKLKNKKAIEFRHGYRLEFLWWVEYEIREQLVEKYKAKAYDDGIGECTEKYIPYSNYNDYYLANYKDVLARIKNNIGNKAYLAHIKMLNKDRDFIRSILPENMKHLVGENL